MYGRVLKAALLSLCLGLVASKNLCAQDAARFGIYGSNTIGARLMPNLVEAYAASAGASTERSASNDPEQVELNLTNRTGAPLAQVDIRSHGSGTGIPALIDGKASIAMLSRPISEKETLALQQAGLPDLRSAEYAHVLAMDGILVFVSPKNPLATLSLDEIAGIFAGTIRDWGAVGGVPGSINVYARDNKSGTFDTFNSLVLRTRNLALRKDAKQFESSEELSDEVARDPNGIGYRRSIRSSAGWSFTPGLWQTARGRPTSCAMRYRWTPVRASSRPVTSTRNSSGSTRANICCASPNPWR
ncbi:MAG: substrate-binding domain-containing protein [Hyphomicrobium sp.]|nr:substrate-binding domain-containing protein [Hyphomicrobium sp.]